MNCPVWFLVFHYGWCAIVSAGYLGSFQICDINNKGIINIVVHFGGVLGTHFLDIYLGSELLCYRVIVCLAL